MIASRSFAVLAVMTFMCIGSALQAHAKTPTVGKDPVQTIRQKCAATNKGLKKYRKVKKELEGFSLERGELTAYFSGPTLMKISATHYGETGKADEDYYYGGGKLIFVQREVYRNQGPGGSSTTLESDDQYFFNNGILIRWVGSDGSPKDSGSAEFREMASKFLDLSNEFVRGARARGKVITAAP